MLSIVFRIVEETKQQKTGFFFPRRFQNNFKMLKRCVLLYNNIKEYLTQTKQEKSIRKLNKSITLLHGDWGRRKKTKNII